MVALVRTIEAPALFPLRLLAVVYTDVFRGIPTILLVYLIGFGIPALDARAACRPSRSSWAGSRSTLSYGAYVGEVYRAGLNRSTAASATRRSRSGSPSARRLRHVILPQAVRRVGPPLLNDFIALQKDVALIAILGVAGEAFRVAQIQAASDFNYTPLIAAALLYLRDHDPAGAAARPLGARARAGAMTPARPCSSSRGVTKSFGELRGPATGSTSRSREHEAVALIGASGSGKSTLLRCVDLLEEIDDGDILLDGEVITDPSVDPVAVRRRLGFIFQAYNLFPHLSVLENVVLGHDEGPRRRRAEAEAEARAQLERLGLGGREDDDPDRLSGGQQQRVAIARAFAARPRAMLLDEVTSALDPELVGEVLEAVRDAQDRGRDDADRDPRDGLRPRGRRRVCFLHEGRLHRGRPARAGARGTPRARDPALPAPPARGRSGLDGQADEAGAGMAGAAMLASSANSARNAATNSESSPLASIIATDSR